VKKTLFAVFVVLGLFVLSVPMAMATSYRITMEIGSYSNGTNGGEYRAWTNPAAFDPDLSWVLKNYSGDTKDIGRADSFQTFCVEEGELFSGSHTYDVVLNDKAINGGVGPKGDPLSIGSAWLYYEFATSGDFDGDATYDYSGSRTTSALELQRALWMLEGEITTVNYNNQFIMAVISKFNSLGAAQADNNGTYGVKVMNLYDANGARAQDQLIFVPDASIMWLLGPAFIMLGFFGRKKRKGYL
jgi:hypothetical protein